MAREKYASVDSTEGIPDTAAIAAAKMKRQARVESSKHDIGGEEDFISLGGGKLIVHDGEDRGPHPESRLMREEDEGDEGDEGKLTLYGRAGADYRSGYVYRSKR
jgi:GC-rich sequence DNA-binding factor